MTARALLLCLLGLLCAVPKSHAQQQPQQSQPQQAGKDQPFTLAVSTQLVVENVVVRDKDGKDILGLTAKDFAITEDNVPQTISVFKFEKLDDGAPPPIAATAGQGAPVPAANDAGKTPVLLVQPQIPTQITPPGSGDARYENRRLMVIFFDLMNIQPADALRAFTYSEKFIRTQMKAPDLISIMVFTNGSIKVLQDFTNDKDALDAVLQKLMYPDDNDNLTADSSGAFGQDAGEFNLFNTDRQLAALQTAVNMLKSINETKSLIYFASGMRLSGTDNQAQLNATTNAANRANVHFFPVDARGLVATMPLGDATRPSPGGIGAFNGATAMASITGFQRSQDSLYALASDTGGKALLDNNDLAAGIVQAEQSITSYYTLGYYSANQNLDGKYRKVKVSLKETQSAKLDYRQGYFAGKTFAKYTTADKERQLEDALMLGDPITDLTIAMELNYFQLNRAEYFVPVTLKIPGSELALAKSGGAERTVIDFIGEIRDDYGSPIQNLREKVDIKLSGESANELQHHPIEYDSGFTLLPGKYVIKVLARDSETGRIGTYQAKFVVPNLMKEEQKVPISSVVLSSQRIAKQDALYNAAKDKNAAAAAAAVNPLIVDGQQLLPSVNRVFSKSRDMFVFLQAYERNATETQPMVAFVTFYRGKTKAFETTPLKIVDGLDPKTKALPIRFSLSLSKLPVGEYNCQVTVLDPMGQKVAFWQAPVMLVN